jgi:lysophospholipase L1-like esterase
MRRILHLAFVALMAGATACGQAATPADVAAPRTDANSMLAHRQLLEKARRGGIDVYFLGDSITRRWGATDYPQLLENWRRNFFGWNAGNFGWGADRTENILWRLEHGELDGVQPKVIVLQAGTNNVGPRAIDGVAIEEITRALAAIVAACRARAPDATVIVTGIFPRNDSMAALPAIARINANLAALADGRRVRYLDGPRSPASDRLRLPGLGRRARADPHRSARAPRGHRSRAAANGRSVGGPIVSAARARTAPAAKSAYHM